MILWEFSICIGFSGYRGRKVENIIIDGLKWDVVSVLFLRLTIEVKARLQEIAIFRLSLDINKFVAFIVHNLFYEIKVFVGIGRK